MASLSFGRLATASRRVCQNGKNIKSTGTTRSFSAIFSMSDEFPDVPSTTPTASTASTSTITKLPSGLTIITENKSSTSTAVLSFPTAGSSSETSSESGAALVNKCLAFKSGSGKSSALLGRILDSSGAASFSEVGRSGAYLGFTCAPDQLEGLLPLLVTDCSYEKWDVKDAQSNAAVIVENANSNAQTVLTEAFYAAAYGAQSTLGKCFYDASTASTAGIQSFRDSHYGINGAILTATGVSDHAAFVNAVSEGFAGANPGTADTTSVTSLYMGGETRIAAPSSGYTHVALGFEGPTSSTPLQNVLNSYLSLSSSSVSSFTAPGLMGLYAASPASSSSTLVDLISTAVDSSMKIDDAVLERAKTLAKAQALMALENGSSLELAQAMSSSVLETGSFSAGEVSKAYDGVTNADLSKALETALKSNVSVAVVGDVSEVPYHAMIASRFSS